MNKEDLVGLGKGAALAIIASLQIVTEWLPTFVLWISAIYGVLHLYVFVRDRLIRGKPGEDGADVEI